MMAHVNNTLGQNTGHACLQPLVLRSMLLIVALALLAPDSALAQDCNNNGIWDSLEYPARPNLYDDDALYNPGDFPRRTALADYNGDGFVDIAVMNPGNIYILLNDGDGVFTVAGPYATADGSFEIASGDMDGDGDVDIVWTNTSGDSVSVLLNNGNGSFTPGPQYDTLNAPSDAVVVDLDADGDLDMAVSHHSDRKILVFLNNGDGTLAAPVAYDSLINRFAITAGDLDGDGDPELIVDGGGFGFLRNNGDGTFAPTTPYALAVQIAIGDLDNDGDLDIAGLGGGFSRMRVLLNDGNGGFSMVGEYLVPVEPRDIAIGDLNGDGKADIAVAEYQYSDAQWRNVSVLFGHGDGTFNIRVLYGASIGSQAANGPDEISIADLDYDGDRDLIVVNRASNDVSILFHGNGDCNGNGIPDDCDIDNATSADCNNNVLPDECEPDSDGDGVIDGCDACPGFNDALDNDNDGAPDLCDICPGFNDSIDPDADGIPSGCDICEGFDDAIDTDGDGVPDGCEIECTNTIFGDVDGSGAANVGDIADFVSVLIEPASARPPEFCAADINEDDYLNSLDIQGFLQIVLAQ